MKNTVKVGEDFDPRWSRLIYAWQKNWTGLVSLAIALVITPVFWPQDGNAADIGVLLSMDFAFLLVFAWAMINYYLRNHYNYVSHGIEIQIRGEPISPNRMYRFLAEEIARWRPWASENDFDLDAALQTYTIRITDNPPVVPVLQDNGDVELEEVIGAAWAHKDFAMIWDKHALDTHGMGHELDHLLSEDANPGIPTHEEEMQWLRDQGIRS